MKIIDRYVGGSVVATALFGVIVLSLVLVLGKAIKELLEIVINNPDIPISTVLMFMALGLPFSLTFTIPWGLLTALLLVFGRISADNELIALKSNGVSVPRICVPVFIVAIALTAVCCWINIEIAPWAEQKITKTLTEIVTSNPAALFRGDEVVDQFPDRRVYVGSKEGDALRNITMFELAEGNEPLKMVHAKEGVIKPDPTNSRLLIELKDARFEQRDEKDPRDITKIRQGIVVSEGVFPIPLDKFYEEHLSGRRLSSYTVPELIEHIGLLKMKKAGTLPEGNEKFAEEVGDNASGKLLEARVELNKRFSASLACFAFALIAIPLGVTTHRKETSVGFALSLTVAFTYFFFIIMADTFRNVPAARPELLIWVPNILFISLGSVLFWRLTKK